MAINLSNLDDFLNPSDISGKAGRHLTRNVVWLEIRGISATLILDPTYPSFDGESGTLAANRRKDVLGPSSVSL